MNKIYCHTVTSNTDSISHFHELGFLFEKEDERKKNFSLELGTEYKGGGEINWR